VIASPVSTYDNAYEFDNVYGHALELLTRNRVHGSVGAIHLDVGCGYGRIAEPLVEALGVHYVGCDADPTALESLKARSFEAHHLILGDEEATLATLRKFVAGRPLASITLLDTLEHLPDKASTLSALSRLAHEADAFVVVSVPNVAHFDIGAKLLMGRWDITDVGILDRTHMSAFSAKNFDQLLRASGLQPVDSFDTRVKIADQHFPADHPLLSESTELGGLLRGLRYCADPAHIDVLQLLRLCLPGPRSAEPPFVKAYAPENRPFLTAVIRTQGRRIHTLRETLLCLYGQTDLDIEVLVVGHRLAPDAIKRVERAIDDQPEEMRMRTRLMRVDDGNRVRPLNVGFSAARGRYISILDDDDTPMAHWVETFRAMDRRAPGRLLRAGSVKQEVRSVVVCGHDGLRAEGSPQAYPKTFDLLDHLRQNHSPPISVAFPRGAFHDLGLRFDETLTTTEDWDYMMRVALLLGATSSPECTGVYRWWIDGESSRTDHALNEWQRNYAAILRKMDTQPVLLPPGTTARLRDLLDRTDSAAASQAHKDLQPILLEEGYKGFNLVKYDQVYGLWQCEDAFDIEHAARGDYSVLLRGESVASVKAQIDALKPTLVTEGYKGFNIFRFDSFYGLPQSEGLFEIERVRRGAYPLLLRGSSLNAVKDQIDSIVVAQMASGENPQPILLEEGYKGFNLVQCDQAYGLPQYEGEFDIGRLRRGEYSLVLRGQNAESVKKQIDANPLMIGVRHRILARLRRIRRGAPTKIKNP